jgi:hypothetical protein
VVTEPLLLIGWLLVSHLTADFVLQTNASVADRNEAGPRARRALGLHALIVAACMVPFWLAFGTPGLIALLVVAVPHPFIDAAKTRLAEIERAASGSTEWSPWPAGLFLLDQIVHLALIFAAWWVLLRDAALNPWFVDRVAQATAGISPDDVHRAALIAVVGWSLAVVNGRAARFFVPLLLPPEASTDPAAGAAVASHSAVGYSVKLGPLSGRLEPDRAAAVDTADNVGAVVGVLERLLVVLLILGHAEIGIGLVVAAKTLARFKQLDERPFAEKYLVGTLASVTVAVASALAARVVLTGI